MKVIKRLKQDNKDCHYTLHIHKEHSNSAAIFTAATGYRLQVRYGR